MSQMINFVFFCRFLDLLMYIVDQLLSRYPEEFYAKFVFTIDVKKCCTFIYLHYDDDDDDEWI